MNLKTKSNQNCQKTKLYGSLITKELKKKHSFRLVGGVDTSSQGTEDAVQGGSWRTRQVRWWLVDWAIPHLLVDKLEEAEERYRQCNPRFQYG